MDHLTVVLVTYNSEHCVPTWSSWLNSGIQVILVDNNSNDNTVEIAINLYPHIRVIRLPKNVGFGKANNMALEIVQTPYALLLNPDCVLKPSDIAELVEQGNQWSEAAIVVPQQVNSKGVLQLNYGPKYQTWKAKLGAVEGAACVGHAGAAVWLLRMDLMKRVGFFDPDFFLYYEDTDLALRVVNAGLQIVVVPTPQVVHISRGSVGGKRRWLSEYWRGYHHAQSKIMFAKKHQGLLLAVCLLKSTYVRAWALLLLRLLFPSPIHLARALGRIQGLRILKSGLSD